MFQFDLRLSTVLVGIVALLLAPPSRAQCPGAGNCCVSHATPGCADLECCTAVCAADAFCCDDQWDGICAGEAGELCGELCGEGGHPATCHERQKLLASDGAANDKFGRSASISGDVAIVGARDDTDNGAGSGSAYVYRSDGASWTQEQKLLASDGAAGDDFGRSVSISDDVTIVGASASNHAEPGSAYVYRSEGGAWTQEQKLVASDGAAYHRFGWSVSINGDVAIVGAFTDGPGSAYAYRFDGVSWTEEQKLLASDGALFHEFGASVCVSGDVAIVGAPHGSGSGAAYVYRFDGVSWTEEQKLLASDGGADWFGGSVSIAGDVAIVGATHDDDNGIRSGSAYVYRYDGASWTQEQKLLASDGAAEDWFGVSVSISGDVATVGAHRDDDNGADSGSAYAYRYDGASWTQEQKLLASDGAQFDLFGIGVSISGGVAIVGASAADGWSGSAYVYDLLACGCPTDTNADGAVDDQDLVTVILAWGSDDAAADVNADGLVDVQDLVEVILNWGPCA